MKIKRWVLVLTLAIGTAMASGCALFVVGAGVAVGAGGMAYVSGELRAADQVPMDRAWDASLRVMNDLQFKVTKSQKDALAGEIVARRADDTKITVRVKRQTDQITEFRIRVGTFGDEALSRLIYERIKKRF